MLYYCAFLLLSFLTQARACVTFKLLGPLGEREEEHHIHTNMPHVINSLEGIFSFFHILSFQIFHHFKIFIFCIALVNKTWSLNRVSPLFHFKSDEEHLKQYSLSLSVHLTCELTTLNDQLMPTVEIFPIGMFFCIIDY